MFTNSGQLFIDFRDEEFNNWSSPHTFTHTENGFENCSPRSLSLSHDLPMISHCWWLKMIFTKHSHDLPIHYIYIYITHRVTLRFLPKMGPGPQGGHPWLLWAFQGQVDGFEATRRPERCPGGEVQGADAALNGDFFHWDFTKKCWLHSDFSWDLMEFKRNEKLGFKFQ